MVGKSFMKILLKFIFSFIPDKRLRKRMRRKSLVYWYTRIASRQAASFGANSLATAKCSLSSRTFVGDCTCLTDVTVLGAGAVGIGNHVSTGPGLVIQTQNHNYKGDLLPYDETFVCKDVVIEDAVWIGMNVFILPGTHIGEGAIIQAGSVVHGNIPPLSIAGGNPAKVFASRDSEHYNALKSKAAYISFN